MESAAARGRNRQQWTRWALLCIILLTFFLRAYHLGRDELWFDEALSAAISGNGWADIIAYTQVTPFEHPPLYYLALHTWTVATGAGEFSLRFFSLFWGVLLIPLLYRFMSSWGGRSFGLLTALTAALSTTFIAHSQTARMYTLTPILAVLLLACFFRALATRRFWWWVAFVLISVLGVATHYYFVLMLLVPITLLLLGGPRYRRLLVLLVAIGLGSALLIVLWSALSPGFRQAMGDVLAGEGGGVSSLQLRTAHTVGGLLFDPPAVGNLAIGALAVLGALLWPLAPPPRTHPVRLIGSRRFLLIWLLVPWLVAMAIPYWLQDRHLAYLLPAFYALVAAGLLVLRAKHRILLWAGVLVLVATSGYGLYLRENQSGFEFGRIMAFIEERALAEDLVIMDQPAYWPLAEYYAGRELATAYLPSSAGLLLVEENVDQQMKALADERSRVWLGPAGAWTEDPESLAGQWLANHGFQAYKEWFPGSGSASLYFMTNSLEPLPVEQGIEWEGQIRLLTAQSSPLVVAPGDALRLSFDWEAIESLAGSYLVSLYLTDSASGVPDGQTWAKRHSEPCGGWCPTDGWVPGTIVQDRHALEVPPGTPPGRYRLQVAWYAPDEGRELVATTGGQRVDLGEVQVARPETLGVEVPRMLPAQFPLQAEFGGQITLLGFDLEGTEIAEGERALLDLYWHTPGQPSADYGLLIELVGEGDQVVAEWERLPASESLPTSNWMTGDKLRGVHWLELPSQVGPGHYQLRLKLMGPDGEPLPLGGTRPRETLGGLVNWQSALEGESLDLAGLDVIERPERPRSYELPEITHPLSARVGRRVELLGYDLVTSAAMPGGQLEVTLYWRGLGPTERPYKVFTHLSGDQLAPLAQHDSYPGGGCCPTDTWAEGEIVADHHTIAIPIDVPPGTYRLTAGMYDESNDNRLAVSEVEGREFDGEHVNIANVWVRPDVAAIPTPVWAEMKNQIYLPLVEANR